MPLNSNAKTIEGTRAHVLYTWKVSGGYNFGELISREPEGIRQPFFLGALLIVPSVHLKISFLLPLVVVEKSIPQRKM